MTTDTPAPAISANGKLGIAGRADEGKRIVHTIDPKFYIGVGKVLEFGAKKYHQRNFLKVPGMAWSRVWDSLQGHLNAFWGGEDLDEETGLHHLYHAGCNIAFLSTYACNEPFKVGDDRPSSIEYKGLQYEAWEKAFEEAQRTGVAQVLTIVPREVEGVPATLDRCREEGHNFVKMEFLGDPDKDYAKCTKCGAEV